MFLLAPRRKPFPLLNQVTLGEEHLIHLSAEMPRFIPLVFQQDQPEDKPYLVLPSSAFQGGRLSFLLSFPFTAD